MKTGPALILVCALCGVCSKTILVIPDAHGDSEHLLQALKNVGIGDDLMIPNNTIIVQLCDLGDRGPNTKQCFTILQNMSIQNANNAGQLVRLVGNHETSHVLIDRDGRSSRVHPKDIEQFCDPSSNQAPTSFPESLIGSSNCLAERRKAFRPDGRFGRDIRDNFQLVHVFRTDAGGDERCDNQGLLPMDSPNTLFVHAGLEPHVLDYVDRAMPAAAQQQQQQQQQQGEEQQQDPAGEPGVEDRVEARLNAAAREALRTLSGGVRFSEAQWLLFFDERSPVWTRRFARRRDDAECATALFPVLRRLNVSRMVMPPANVRAPRVVASATRRCTCIASLHMQ
jgi:hypothetical protein